MLLHRGLTLKLLDCFVCLLFLNFAHHELLKNARSTALISVFFVELFFNILIILSEILEIYAFIQRFRRLLIRIERPMFFSHFLHYPTFYLLNEFPELTVNS
jgi:hypothetical protein